MQEAKREGKLSLTDRIKRADMVSATVGDRVSDAVNVVLGIAVHIGGSTNPNPNDLEAIQSSLIDRLLLFDPTLHPWRVTPYPLRGLLPDHQDHPLVSSRP